ncbi:MAG: hypothetical protein EBT03_09620 [Betaproteobacteria bacterium]|jgi:hypothetical protein|nr:hypothetical protein [Betaproteobacteria bacterium]NCA17318.1 hypothetical protein [Betaproteobacteria bacterium]
MPENYTMPSVEVAEWVLYYPHENSSPYPAMVTKVGTNCLTLWVVSAGGGGVERFSIHHKTDPGLKEFPDWARAGMWAHANTRHAGLAEKLAALEKRVAELEGRRGK